jgi:hypothetical protein
MAFIFNQSEPICGREEAWSQKNLPPFAAGHDSTAMAALHDSSSWTISM